MRAATDTRCLEVDPGDHTAVVVDVVNTGEVIDGVSAHVIGLSDEFVRTQPELLPLFPSTGGQLTVSLAIPPTHPAGRHPITVELVSHGARLPSQYLDVDLDVSAQPSMRMAAVPRVVRARRTGRFVFEIKNDGNVPLDVTLEAVDPDRALKTTFTPPVVRVEPGSVTPVLLHLRGPRMFTGAETDRNLTVTATGVRADAPDSDITVAAPVPREANVRLKQRPLISRGLLTALVLMTIVGLWAAVFLLGLTKVFSNDPMTKAAPASFFTAKSTTANANTAVGGSGSGSSGADVAPAGALPKDGQLPAGIGGEISGTVLAASDRSAVGQVLVNAYRMGRDDKLVPASSAATQSDGTYTLAGLFPTDYYLQFSGTGFTPVWWPAAPTQAAAQTVSASSGGSTIGVNATLTGQPATITGTVDPGDTSGTPPTTKVTVYSLTSSGAGVVAAHASTSGGKYTVSGLSAPGSYKLTFTTDGYQTSSLVDTVSAGDKRIEPKLTLDAGLGTISGFVRGADQTGIGGATVTTTVAGAAVSVVTPTTGLVGQYTLTGLPTPATYIVTFTEPDFGSHTEVIDLKAGQNAVTNVDLAGGRGTLSGVVYGVGADKAGLGGATVTVGGATTSSGSGSDLPTTTSETQAPNAGHFLFNDLPNGEYTVTFSAPGYTPLSVSATVGNPPLAIHLTQDSGAIQGVVRTVDSAGRNPAHPAGTTVTISDGDQQWTASTTSAGVGAGGYLVSGLPAGTYTVTATRDGYRQQTRIVTVTDSQTVSGVNLTVRAES